MASLVGCVKSEETPFEEVEKVALKAWMEQNRPELLANYQSEGGYYVELLNEGNADSLPVEPMANSSMFNFPSRIEPDAFKRAITVAS